MTETAPEGRKYRRIRLPGAVYSESDLAEILDTSEEVLRGLRQTGQLRYLRVGRSVRYPDEYVEEYIRTAGVREDDPVADRLALVRRG